MVPFDFVSQNERPDEAQDGSASAQSAPHHTSARHSTAHHTKEEKEIERPNEPEVARDDVLGSDVDDFDPLGFDKVQSHRDVFDLLWVDARMRMPP